MAHAVALFFIMGDFKLDNIDTFTRAVDNVYVTTDACKVWLLWYHAWRDVWYNGIMHGTTDVYYGKVYGATYD